MTKQDFQLIAETLKNEKPVHLPSAYYDMSEWEKGAYDEWHTTVLAFVRLCHASATLDRNGNNRFDSERFLKACDATELMETKVTLLHG